MLMLALSIIYLSFIFIQTGDIIRKDVSLTGGTTITFQSQLSPSEVKQALSSQFPDIDVKALSDNSGKQTNLVVTVPEQNSDKIVSSLENYLGYKLTEQNSSIEFTGAALGQDFYAQLIKALVFAFILMALVVFIVFGESKKIKSFATLLTLSTAALTFPLSRFINILVFTLALGVFFYSLYLGKSRKDYLISTALMAIFVILFIFPIYYVIIPLAIVLVTIYSIFSVPSIAVILSAFADIVLAIAVVDLIGMKVSSAGIVAFLMLVGYSVDTDILLTTRVLRTIWGAFKTGSTMTFTSIIAVLIALIIVYNYGSILNQIFLILIIGLGFDLLNTWVTNASIIKWYAEARHR